jgi:hypothetical protein
MEFVRMGSLGQNIKTHIGKNAYMGIRQMAVSSSSLEEYA